MRNWVKILHACLLSWLFLAAIGMVLGGFKILGSKESTTGLILPLLLAFLACYGIAWVNSRSILFSFFCAFGGLLIGLPVSYLLLVPFGIWLVEHLFPWSNLGLSGSLAGGWFFLGIIVVLEILTDRVLVNKRWLMLLVGVLSVMVLIHIIEYIVSIAGTSNEFNFLLALYAPFIWGCIIWAVNLRSIEQANT